MKRIVKFDRWCAIIYMEATRYMKIASLTAEEAVDKVFEIEKYNFIKNNMKDIKNNVLRLLSVEKNKPYQIV